MCLFVGRAGLLLWFRVVLFASIITLYMIWWNLCGLDIHIRTVASVYTVPLPVCPSIQVPDEEDDAIEIGQ